MFTLGEKSILKSENKSLDDCRQQTLLNTTAWTELSTLNIFLLIDANVEMKNIHQLAEVVWL